MATYYAQAGGNWDAVSGGTTSSVWFTASTGGTALDISGLVSGTTWTDAANTYDLNGQAVNLNVGASVNCTIIVAVIRSGATIAAGTIAVGNSGAVVLGAVGNLCSVTSSYAGTLLTWGTGTCSLTINGGVTYSSTSTAGMLTVGTGQTITIQNTGGAATTSLTCSAAGYGIVISGSAVLTISNSGGTAILSNSNGRGVSGASTGASTITGTVSSTGSGYGILITGTGSGGSLTIDGDINAASTGIALFNGTAGYTVTFNGTITQTGATSIAISQSNGTINWTGTRAIAAGNYITIQITNGTMNLGTSGASLTINNSGAFTLRYTGGTLVTTYGTFVNYTSTAQTAFMGIAVTVTGPTIPTAANVYAPAYPTGYGYAGGAITPTLRGSTIHSATSYPGGAVALTAGILKDDEVVDDVTGTYVGSGGGRKLLGALRGT